MSAASSHGLLIYVHSLGGEKAPIEVKADATVGDVLHAYEELKGAGRGGKLNYQGAELRASDSLADCGVCSQCVLEYTGHQGPQGLLWKKSGLFSRKSQLLQCVVQDNTLLLYNHQGGEQVGSVDLSDPSTQWGPRGEKGIVLTHRTGGGKEAKLRLEAESLTKRKEWVQHLNACQPLPAFSGEVTPEELKVLEARLIAFYRRHDFRDDSSEAQEEKVPQILELVATGRARLDDILRSIERKYGIPLPELSEDSTAEAAPAASALIRGLPSDMPVDEEGIPLGFEDRRLAILELLRQQNALRGHIRALGGVPAY